VDAVIFPSEGKYGDTETNPLAIKEAIAWDIPLFLRNIPVYMNGYPESNLVKWMVHDLEENSKILYSMLNLMNNYSLIKPDFFNQKLFDINFDNSDNKVTINYLYDAPFDMMVCIRDIDTEIPIFSFSAKFENKNSYWAIPLPKSYYDFAKNPNFSGFLVDFYDPGGNLLYSQSYQIKFIDTQKKKFRIDTYEPVFVNFEQFFTDKIYDKFFSQIENLDYVLDIGSSVGLFTELAKDKAAKKIMAFEVSNRATKIFNNLHGEDSRVELMKMAIWDKKEKIKIYEDENNSIISSAITKTDKYFEISSVDLDSVFRENNIERVSLMKMDIEGSEYKAFEGLSDENLTKIENIILEFHDNIDNKLSNITSRFKNLGYEVQIFTEDCKTKSNPYIDQKGVVFMAKIPDFDRSQKIISRKSTTKPIIIISCHITDTRSSEILKSCIRNLKKTGFDLALIGNSIVDKEILEQIDHYFYSKETPLFSEIYTSLTLVNFILYRQSEGVIYNDFTESHQQHGLPILINLFNCLNFLKSKGYQHFYRIEGDSILSENAIPFFVEMWEQCVEHDKKGFVFENTSEKNISTHLLFSEIDFFLENVKQIYTEPDYIDYLQKKSGNLDFLTVEEYLFDNLKNTDCLIRYDGTQFEKYFLNSDWNLLVSSHSFPPKYRGCTTRLSKNKKDGSTVIFSINYTSEKIIRHITIYFTDKIEKLEHHMTSGNISDWCWNLYTEKIEKIEVFQDGEFLYQEKYEDMINIIEFL
jgi:FkbM family methyltransferase